jgi:hypothetical protein
LLASSVPAGTFTVTNTADSGPGSLRQALLDAQNCAGAPHTIEFDVPAGPLTNGVALIAPASALPAITCPGTTVDGPSQTINQGNTNDVTLGAGGTVGTGPDGRAGTGDEPILPQLNGPEVEIDASALAAAILSISADNVTVRGLSLHGGGTFGGLVENLPDPLPALGSHCRSSSRKSQAFADRKSRLIDDGETSMTSAVSSIVSPPKKRSSTIWA